MSKALQVLVRDHIIKVCQRLVAQAGLIHQVPPGQDTQEMTAAYQELYRLTLGMLTGESEDVPAATAMTHLSGVITNLLQYAAHLGENEDQLVQDTITLDNLEAAIEDISVGIDSASFPGDSTFRDFVRAVLNARLNGGHSTFQGLVRAVLRKLPKG